MKHQTAALIDVVVNVVSLPVGVPGVIINRQLTVPHVTGDPQSKLLVISVFQCIPSISIQRCKCTVHLKVSFNFPAIYLPGSGRLYSIQYLRYIAVCYVFLSGTINTFPDH